MSVGHVEDRWWTRNGAAAARTRSDRYGRGRRWLAVWTEPGGRRRKQSFESKTAAAAHLAQVQVDQQGGRYITVDRARVLFGDHGRQWLDARRLADTPSTAALRQQRWRLHIEPHLGHLPVGAVTRQQVQHMVSAWHTGSACRPPLGAGTIAVTFRMVKAMFAAAVRDRMIPETPCTGIVLPVERRRRVEVLTVGQVRVITDQVPAHFRAMVVLAAASGLRIGELRSLTVDRLLGMSDQGVTVRVDRQLRPGGGWGPPKTPASERDIPIDPDTAGVLRRHLARHPPGQDGLMFRSQRGRALTNSTAVGIWTYHVTPLGIPAATGWHAMRHFHASLLIASGLSARAVAERLGHQNAAITMRVYAHLWPDDQSRATDAVMAAMRAGPHPAPRLRIAAGGRP